MDKVLCIVGPTASGKTELAVALACRVNGEIVSCDSMQVYRGMDVGTAKPSLEERRGIPHHMLDVAEPEEAFSAGRFAAMAGPIVEDILARGKTAILAGGTGLYMDALVRGSGFAPVPQSGRREELEALAKKEGIASILERLKEVDPDAAQRLHPSDEKRIIRALEVFLETGETITAHNLKTQALPPKYNPIFIGLDFENRADLYRRIDRRVDYMAENGLWQEVEGLLARGVPQNATAMQAIGYKEPMAALRGEISRAEAVAAIKQSTRRYAKRQLTWFRRNPKTHWILRGENEDFSRVFAEAAAQIPFFDSASW